MCVIHIHLYWQIRVSLSHEDSCYRRYDLGLGEQTATTKNEIELHFKLNKPLRGENMLLFLLSNAETV